jgi:homoserine kinase type II
VAVERLGGSNNASWRAETAAGAVVVRVYRNAGNLPHIEFEHALLEQLAHAGLSFKVPLPLRSRGGRTLESIDIEGQKVQASVFEVIPGEHPRDWTNLGWVRAAGTALGELDAAMAGIVMPAGLTALPLYGHLDRVHWAVPKPEEAITTLPLDRSLTEAFQGFLARIRERMPRLYDTLPRQIIHSDLAGSNLLLQGERVTGILDFEFASPDLRAMDLTAAVGQMGLPPAADALDLDFVQALAEGYGEAVRLTSREVSAAPDLLLLRGAVSVIHRTGRRLEGLSPLEAVESRIRHVLRLERWLEGHRETVVQSLAAVSTESPTLRWSHDARAPCSAHGKRGNTQP